MTPSEASSLGLLLSSATPFLRISDVSRHDWCRVMQNPRDGRFGPWKYLANMEVLNADVWGRGGEVIYFVTDSQKRLRLVGQSMSRLKGRWKLAPMYDPNSLRPLGRKALFHTSSWPAIEAGLLAGEPPPFEVSALFRNELDVVCSSAGESLAAIRSTPETHLQRLSYHVETWVCSLDFGSHPLWNKQKVAMR